MRLQTIKIASGQAFDLAATGDYIRVRYSAVDLTIEQPDSGEVIEVSQGDDFEFTPFSRLRISHASGADQTVKLIVSKGKRAGSSQVSGSLSIAGGAYEQTRKTVSNGAAVELLAANTARKAGMIQNNDSGAVLRFTLDGSTPTATAGFRLLAGDAFDLPAYAATGAVMGIMETAGSGSNNIEVAEG